MGCEFLLIAIKKSIATIAQILVLYLPAIINSTHHMLNAKLLSWFPSTSSYLIWSKQVWNPAITEKHAVVIEILAVCHKRFFSLWNNQKIRNLRGRYEMLVTKNETWELGESKLVTLDVLDDLTKIGNQRCNSGFPKHWC